MVEFAARMDLSEKHISNLLNGTAALIHPVAFRLEMVLGISADFWERLESKYRADLIRVEDENNLDADIDVSQNFPYSEMVKFGWVPPSNQPCEKVIALRKFFEVSRMNLLILRANSCPSPIKAIMHLWLGLKKPSSTREK